MRGAIASPLSNTHTAPPHTLARVQGKNASDAAPSKTALCIIRLPRELPRARVLYSSATGAPLAARVRSGCAASRQPSPRRTPSEQTQAPPAGSTLRLLHPPEC